MAANLRHLARFMRQTSYQNGHWLLNFIAEDRLMLNYYWKKFACSVFPVKISCLSANCKKMSMQIFSPRKKKKLTASADRYREKRDFNVLCCLKVAVKNHM